MSTLKRQIDIVKFLRRYPDTYFPYSNNRETVEILCATHNLGILTLAGDQMILRSIEKADRFIENYSK